MEEKFEEFCKPQANELRARFDLLTSFRQTDMSVDEWHNAVQTQVALARYPPETAQILQRDIFWFFLKDESFVSKTLNEGHVELSKFPASKVRQMAKILESSQTTAKHMRQVTKYPQATQVNLLRHQRTELPQSKFQRKQNKRYKSRQPLNKNYQEDKYRERRPRAKERFHKDPQEHTSFEDSCSKCGDTPLQRDLDALQADSNANIATNLDISANHVTRKKSQNTRKIQENPKHTK